MFSNFLLKISYTKPKQNKKCLKKSKQENLKHHIQYNPTNCTNGVQKGLLIKRNLLVGIPQRKISDLSYQSNSEKQTMNVFCYFVQFCKMYTLVIQTML